MKDLENFKSIITEVIEWEEAIIDMNQKGIKIPKVCSRKMHESFDAALECIAHLRNEGLDNIDLAEVVIEIMNMNINK